MPKAGCILGRRSSNRLRAILSSFLAVAPALCLGQAANRVTAVRYWSTGDTTRVAVEVSAEFNYKSDRLENPPRLFFDVQGARPVMAQKTIVVGDRLLKQIRIAETQPGTTRIVLDLEQDADFTASQLSNPERLMLEIRSKGAKVSATTETEAPARPEPRKFDPPPVREARTETPYAAKTLPAPPVLASVNRPAAAAPGTEVRKLPGPPPLPEPKAAARNANGDRSLTRVLGLKLGRVVLDPGHGGHDVGTHGPSGLYEKDLVLDISQRLAALLQDRLGSEVLLTRNDDTYISLEGRTKIANDYKADLFLSIHANSSPVKSVTGVETYYLNFTTSRTAMDVAARENATAESSIFDLKDVLEKIALKDKIDESREFASRLQTSLFTLTKASATRNRGVKKAPFVVLIGAQMPSVLAEIGFLTNASDEALMRKNEHRQKIAEALYKGIAAYGETLSQVKVAVRE
ncbi:MAG: N-acetylmuramoyl-L-alanine amidase [Bryobacterales bacterium]|nr:N-acetylmuramoyl-L-alanine amidase [Bryobacterales bacterium]